VLVFILGHKIKFEDARISSVTASNDPELQSTPDPVQHAVIINDVIYKTITFKFAKAH
jgi:hypothetical protein